MEIIKVKKEANGKGSFMDKRAEKIFIKLVAFYFRKL